MRPVGILGGMGPEATILLMQKVLNAVPAADDSDHVPLIVHQNPQVPSRIKALIEGTGQDPAPALAQMACDLQAAGAQALAMPCNTAHHYAHAVTKACDLAFLNMLDLTAETLVGQGARRIGMLASPATRLAGVFDVPFSASGLTPVWTTDEDALLRIIQAVKAGQAGAVKDDLRAVADDVLAQGADRLMVACTELSLLTDVLPDGVAWTDSLDCLTDGIVAFAQG
ncbi:amino acid racemase [Roseovarius aestuarii]|nr:amino acid racemase [Roseovarius aestuarii]